MKTTKKKDTVIRYLYYFTRRREGMLASAGDDKIIRVFNMSDPNELDRLSYVLKGHTKSVLSMIVVPNKNYLISGSRDRTIRIWDFKTGQT